MPRTLSEDLLLAACRGDACLESSDDWTAIAALARKHEVAPLLYWGLKSTLGSEPSDPSAAAVWAALHRSYAESVIQNDLAGHELGKLLDALATIPSLVLKGPVLAGTLYQHGCRLYADLDVAVRERDYEAARDAFLGLGYRPMPPYIERYQRVVARDLAFVRRDEHGLQWSVELHWRLAEPHTFQLDEEGIWHRSVPVEVGGKLVWTPNPDDTLLLLALNLRRHRFGRLKTLCDIDLLLRHYQDSLDWSLIHQRAHAGEACVTLFQTLRLVERLFNSPMGEILRCERSNGFLGGLLHRLLSDDLVLRDGRNAESLRPVLGLLPFVAGDRVGTTAKLVFRRLTLLPDYASYHVGSMGRYSSRLSYLAETSRQIMQAVGALPRLPAAPTRSSARTDSRAHELADERAGAVSRVRPRVVLVSEDLSLPSDEGLKNLVAALVEPLRQTCDLLVISSRASGTVAGGVRSIPTNRLLLGIALRRAVRSFRPETVIYVPRSSATISSFVRATVLRSYVPRARAIMLSLQPRTYGPLARRYIRAFHPDLTLVQSISTRDQLRTLDCPSAILPSGVDLAVFQPAREDRRRALREKYGLPVDAFIVLHVGHLRRSRNVLLLNRIQQQTGALTLLVGSTSTPGGPEEGVVSELRKGGTRIIETFVPEIAELYQLSDCYLFPVWSSANAIEAPLSVLEAMACDLPVVTTPYGFLPANFQSSASFVFASNDEDLVTAVERIRSNPNHRVAGDVRRQVVAFDWSEIAEQLLRFALPLRSRAMQKAPRSGVVRPGLVEAGV